MFITRLLMYKMYCTRPASDLCRSRTQVRGSRPAQLLYGSLNLPPGAWSCTGYVRIFKITHKFDLFIFSTENILFLTRFDKNSVNSVLFIECIPSTLYLRFILTLKIQTDETLMHMLIQCSSYVLCELIIYCILSLIHI